MASEIDRVLAQYGQGYTSPQLNSGDGEIASTPDILAQYGANERMASGIPGFLRRIGAGLRSLAPSQVTTPVNTLTGREPNLRAREDHANPLMLMGGEGADTMASWMDMHPGVDRGQSRPQDLLAPLGLSAMAPLTAVNNAAGIFGGRLARTADREALSRAEEMAGRGAPRNEIWDQTGWFKGVDGKWRFEIDDSQARLTPRAQEAFRSPSDTPLHSVLPGVMDHPELYRAYPDLAYTGVTARRSGDGPSGGSYAHDVDRIEAVAPNPEQGLSTILHEGTHGLSNPNREGFAPGAAADTFQQQRDAQLARDALSFRREIEAANFGPGVDWIAKENAIIDQYRRLGAMDWVPSREARDLARDSYNNPNGQLAELVRFYGLDQRTTPLSAREMYRRTAGEVEARNVQTRQHMTPEERRSRPPWETQDVPDADQILRQYSSGPQMSVRDPTHNEGLAYLLGPRSQVDVIGAETGTVRPNGVSHLRLKDAPEGYEGARFVYTRDGQIVGAMQVMRTPDGPATVANTYVAPEFRRQGVATELNRAAEEAFGPLQRSDGPSEAGAAFRSSLSQPENVDAILGQYGRAPATKGGDGPQTSTPTTPIRAYHGTTGELVGGRFDMEHPRQTGSSFNRHGVSLSPDPRVADRYAMTFGGDAPNVIPADVTLQRPLNLTASQFERLQTLTGKIERREPISELDGLFLEDVLGQTYRQGQHPIDAILSQGYDGIIKDAGRWGIAEPEILALAPNTVRSATTGNTLYSNPAAASLPGTLANQGDPDRE